MPKIKMEIEEFDRLSITDLMQAKDKELMVAIYIKIKQQNNKLGKHEDKLKWHDTFIWGVISTIGLGITAGLVLGIIKLCFLFN